eukprot:5055518-Pyramimonas_sp.AAC.1
MAPHPVLQSGEVHWHALLKQLLALLFPRPAALGERRRRLGATSLTVSYTHLRAHETGAYL